MPADTLTCVVGTMGGEKPVAVDQEEIDARAQSARMADWKAGHFVYTTFNTCYQQDSFKAENCGTDSSPPNEQLQKEVILKIEGEGLANRILFRLSDWVRMHTEDIRHGETPAIITYDQYFDRLSAINLLTAAPPAVGPAAYALKKFKEAGSNEMLTIAVIGASYEDSRDAHITPLGVMPGSLVLVNAIDTLQTVGILQSLPTLVILSITALILVAISAAFALLSALWASVLMLALVALTMGPLSFWFLKHGIWLDIGAPIIGIYLHRELEDIIERFNNNKSHQ